MPARKNLQQKSVPQEKHVPHNKLVFTLIGIIFLLAGIWIGIQFPKLKEQIVYVSQPLKQPSNAVYSVEMFVPAVDNEGRGVPTMLRVESLSGLGRVLTNIDVLTFWTDTQESIRTAKEVAVRTTKIDAGSLDLIYSVSVDNVSAVGGPSAGAALTIATIGVLENRQPANNIMITGTVDQNGNIGRVGGVYEKAVAAKSVNTTLFLVPVGEGYDTKVTPVESCSYAGGTQVCQTTYNRTRVSIGANLSLEVKEVKNIAEAMQYFFSGA